LESRSHDDPPADRPPVTRMGVIEASIPSLADVLRPEFENMAGELGTPPGTETSSEPVAEAGDVPPRATLARLLSLQVTVHMAPALETDDERATVALALQHALERGEARPEPIGEEQARLAIERRIADPDLREAFMQRIDAAASEGVSRVLLGAPGPMEANPPTVQDAGGMALRLVAFLLDLSVVWSVSLVAGFLMPLLDLSGVGTLPVNLAIGFIGMLVNVQLLSTTGTTLGKLTMGLRVVRSGDGADVTMSAALLRESVGRLTCQVTFGIGYLAAFFNPMRRTLADLIADTVVVRLRAPLPWAHTARMITAATAVVAFIYLPAVWATTSVEQAWAEKRDEQTPRLLQLVDSVFVLATRPVENDEQMRRDLAGILELAPGCRAGYAHLAQGCHKVHRMRSLVLPWTARSYAQLDSFYTLRVRSLDDVQEFARISMSAPPGKAREARDARVLAEYAFSDYKADHQYALRLISSMGK
jgi:uncharacterized RDD family membrane protein YckC